MSPSINKTRFPSCAKEIDRLLATVVLPSPGSALTNVKERGGRPAAESKTDVRNPRKASERAEC